MGSHDRARDLLVIGVNENGRFQGIETIRGS
jgi:hypothetical protein